MTRLIRLLTCALAALSATAAVAAGGGLTVALKHSRRIMLSAPAANVVVGDPAIADVAMVDSRSVVVIGKGYGSTDVLVLDHAGHTLLDARVKVVAPDDQVTIHRGLALSDLSCDPHCHPATGGATDAAGGGAAPRPPSP